MIVRFDRLILSQAVLVVIGFNLPKKLPAGAIDVAFTLQENVWNGRTTIHSTSATFVRQCYDEPFYLVNHQPRTMIPRMIRYQPNGMRLCFRR